MEHCQKEDLFRFSNFVVNLLCSQAVWGQDEMWLVDEWLGGLCFSTAHNAMTGTTGCLALGTLAFFTKAGKMEGWRLTGPPKL